ncbi:hypothetical protein C0992_001538 [Termitomyces sp. T32_za158]|nr:hypothetical protein C0992_001538 [Termitomyces sp. T32_za158]
MEKLYRHSVKPFEPPLQHTTRLHLHSTPPLPQPTLDWSRVSHYTFLEDFTLLRETNHDIQEKPWAKPVIHELIKQNQKVKCAHEEITRCNVEVCRLHTSIVDEQLFFSRCLLEIKASNPLIYGAVDEFAIRHQCVNAHLLVKISQIYALTGFSGIPKHGDKKGSMMIDSSDIRADNLDSMARIEDGEQHKLAGIDAEDDVQCESDDDDEVEAFDGI